MPDADAADERRRAAAEAFRAQEVLAAASAPVVVALAQKPRLRRIVKEAETEVSSAAIATGSPVAIAPTTPAQPFEPAAPARSATSVMGGAPDSGDARSQPE